MTPKPVHERKASDKKRDGGFAYNKCPECGRMKSRKSKRCMECATATKLEDIQPQPKPFNIGSSKKRFHVFSVTGYRIYPGVDYATAAKNPSTTWAVLDAHCCWQEVAIFEPRTGGQTNVWCERQARELCARLNAEEAEAA